ncbi:hypothetical protein [Gorillibacterium massiliense]|uniref:hypothetical protein n=1 Tax=Gorillibacterium massiliense TaxID=1280390 RepID=UPI0004B94CBF|nr:hypothetical protein [Gorillibacterium massiliense]
MIPYLTYLFKAYTRTYRFIGPVCLFLITVFFLYAVEPNPVMSSYAITAVALFPVSAWFAFDIARMEQKAQEQISYLALGSLPVYLAGKIVIAWFLSICMTVVALVTPLILDVFSEPATPAMLAVAFVSHILVALAGIAAAACFSLLRKTSTAVGGLAIVLLLSASRGGMADSLSGGWKLLKWPFLPVYELSAVWFSDNLGRLSDAVTPLLGLLAYTVIYFLLYGGIARKRAF